MKGNCKRTLPVVLLLNLILEREVVESERIYAGSQLTGMS